MSDKNIADPSWIALAEQFDAALRSADAGAREVAAQVFGRSVGRRPDTLRAYSTARRFLAAVAVNDDALATQLRSAPVNALCVLARWRAYDPGAAEKAAGRLAAGELSIRELGRLEKKSRPNERAGAKPKLAFVSRIFACGGFWWRSLGMEFRVEEGSLKPPEDITPDRTGPVEFGGRFREPPPMLRRAFRIDLIAGLDEAEVAILAVGPYNDDAFYRSRCAEWLLMAIGVSQFLSRVALVLPNKADPQPFVSWLTTTADMFPSKPPPIHILHETSDGRFEWVYSDVVEEARRNGEIIGAAFSQSTEK